MVEERVVDIDRDNVHVLVTRVPFCIERAVVVTEFRVGIDVPYPDEVCEFICIHHAVEHEAVKLHVALGTSRAPPEPATAGLVQGAPHDGDSLFLKFLEIARDNVHVGDDVLVDLRSRVNFLAGGILEGLRVVEAGVVVGRLRDTFGATRIPVAFLLRVENRVFPDLPVPGISRNAAHFPQLLGHHQVVFGVALEPAFFVVTACRKQHVEAANGGVVPATLVEFGDVGLTLPRDFLVAELAGICGRAATRRNEPHVAIIVVEILVADHHAANGLLAEIFAQEGVDLAGRFRRVRCYRQFANLEYRVGVAFDGNVVHAESLVPYGNLVFAGLHLGRCRNHVARIAVARGGKHGAYIYAVDRDFRGGPVVLLD